MREISGPRVSVYRGLRNQARFFRDVSEVFGGAISPGGASAVLKTSTQYIYELIKRGEVRAWVYYEDVGKQADMIVVAVKDLVYYGVRVGRIKEVEDIGLSFPLMSKIVDDCKASVLHLGSRAKKKPVSV